MHGMGGVQQGKIIMQMSVGKSMENASIG